MTLWFPKIECPRGLTTCRSYGQVVSSDDDPMQGSFFCCGKHDGTMAPVEQDIYTKCFHGELRDDIRFYDRRDLVDEMNVMASALSHIELDMMEAEIPSAQPTRLNALAGVNQTQMPDGSPVRINAR